MSEKLQDFLKAHGWADARIDWFGADWSVRNYARLTRADGKTAILLQSPPDDSPEAMVGHMVAPWLRVQRHCESLGLPVPQVYAADDSAAFILLEDFGMDTIRDKGAEAYLQATDLLVHMRDHPQALNISSLLKYEDTHVYKALQYYPVYVLGHKESITEWFACWRAVENSLPPCPRALTHIDYHAANLMWRDGDRIGIIDFQGACEGPFVYDMVNLLEDIRCDIPQAIKQACKTRYCAKLSPQDRESFDQWYPVMTAQFHARILGVIQRLAIEKNRMDLMQYENDLAKRFAAEIDHPSLKPIKDFIEKYRHCEERSDEAIHRMEQRIESLRI